LATVPEFKCAILPVPSTYWADRLTPLPQVFVMEPTDAWHLHDPP